jgi:hypothetical protein
MEHQQLDLFSNLSLNSGCRTEGLVMDVQALVQWKQRYEKLCITLFWRVFPLVLLEWKMFHSLEKPTTLT